MKIGDMVIAKATGKTYYIAHIEPIGIQAGEYTLGNFLFCNSIETDESGVIFDNSEVEFVEEEE